VKSVSEVNLRGGGPGSGRSVSNTRTGAGVAAKRHDVLIECSTAGIGAVDQRLAAGADMH